MKLKTTSHYVRALVWLFVLGNSLGIMAQQNVEIEDGKLIVKRTSALSEIEISSSGAQDAQIQFGDNGSATDITMGWSSNNQRFSLSGGSVLDANGFTLSGTGTGTRFGFGTAPDLNALIFAQHNTSLTTPALLLQENNNGDTVRMHFGQFAVSDVWQLGGWAATGPTFRHTWLDNGVQNHVLTLDGDDGRVIVDDGKLEVFKTTGAAVVEITSRSATGDAQIEFGDNNSANDAIIGWDNSTTELRLLTGTSLAAGGININSSDEIGLGTSNDTDAKVLIQNNSDAGATPSPQLFLRENNNSDFARLQFGQFGVSEYWHIAAKGDAGGAGPKMNFFFFDGTTGTNVIEVDGDDALVGINRTPTTNDLEVGGTASKTAAGDWLANSDRRIKTDIREIENSFETMLRLRPVKFMYTEEWKKKNTSIRDHYYYNFIAQEYREVFPESVKGSGEYLDGDPTEILQIDTYNAQIVNIAATQELIRENEALKKELAELRTMFNNLNQSVQALTSLIGKSQHTAAED